MATKSILKSVNIRGKSRVRDFVTALERAEKLTEKEVLLQRPVVEVRTDQIKSLLANYSS